MYRIKLFSATQMTALQTTINDWLHMKKDILIHSSNLASNNNEVMDSSEYNFYILYSGADDQAEELKELAAAVTQDQSIDVKEINPEILKPSS